MLSVIHYEVTPEEAGLLMNALAELPFKVSAPLIQKMQGQAQSQVEAAQAAANPQAPVEAPTAAAQPQAPEDLPRANEPEGE